MSAPQELVQVARDWASDCSWKEDPEELAEMSDTEILRGVNRHYGGGLAQCARDALLDENTVTWATTAYVKGDEGRTR